MKSTAKITSILALLMAAISLPACSPPGAAEGHAKINQADLCEIKGWQLDVTSGACKPGQKVVFLPQSWGNEQLPILFAAVNCDMRYSVALTNGGVVCIYNPITPADKKEEPAPEASKP